MSTNRLNDVVAECSKCGKWAVTKTPIARSPAEPRTRGKSAAGSEPVLGEHIKCLRCGYEEDRMF
jgi:hypothetical protein